MEMYPRGRRGGFAKALGGATCAEVRILSSPPYEINALGRDSGGILIYFIITSTYFSRYLFDPVIRPSCDIRSRTDSATISAFKTTGSDRFR